MKRLVLHLICLLLATTLVLAQQVNLYTIPNQSAHFVRMPSRGASTEIDAVFQNPAGLTHMKDGLHFSISNQLVFQNFNMEADYKYLEDQHGEYTGKLRAYFFPGVFMAYKKNKYVVSAGAFLVGGGGGADFDNLPSADIGMSDIIPALKTQLLDNYNNIVTTQTGEDHGFNNLTDYRYDFYSNGRAYSPGYQLGFSYLVNEYFSVGVAGRVVSSTVRALGHVKDIQINVPQYGGYQSPTGYLTYLSERPETSPIQAQILTAVASVYEELAQDRLIDVTQRGYGYTPVVSIHSKPIPKLDVAVKYEHRTKVKLRTTVHDGKDGGGQFTQGEVISSDLPGFISMGAKYQILPKMIAAIGGRYFFDKSADYNGREKLVEKNYFEVEMALEYDLAEKIKVSGGYTFNKARVQTDYQNEVDHRLPGHTVAAGGAYVFNDDLTFNVGVLYTHSKSETHIYSNEFAQGYVEGDPIPYNLTYSKRAVLVAVGVDLSLFN